MQKSRTCIEDSVAMDAKDLRIETALGERNDGSKYSQSGVALQCNGNKSYQDIGSNPLSKAEAPVRPCAVIGPDRVVPPTASNDAYLKKASVDLWPSPDNLYPRPPEYPHKQQNNVNVNPTRNISPRQTFQENMQRILVPPTYSAVKHADESNLNRLQDRNAALSKNTKQTIAPEPKYCDVPYSVNLLTNEHKNAREMDMCASSVNSPLTRNATHGWLPSSVNLHAPRTYGAHEVYQYPQYPSCAGPRPSVMPVARPHRAYQEETSYVYPESYYQDASVRFKPYPSVKEHNPQARYDYISNYPNSFHPPPPYAQHKYDIPNTRPPHPYSVYPHLKYLDNRGPDPNIEGYQRTNQPSINYNMQFRNQVIHPSYAPPIGSTQSKLPSYPPDASVKSSNKMPFDNNKAFIDYENAKPKYSLPDSYFVNEIPRTHQVQKPVAMPNYGSPGVHPVPVQQYHRKDNIPMRTYEYMPHYRHFEHLIGFNPSGHHPPQFSPSMLAISPTDSNTSIDTTQTQGTLLEDCGYVSQSSTTSARSADSGIRLPTDYYRRYDYRYRPIIGNSHMLPKSNVNATNSNENKKIDVRQFLSMWNEGDEDNSSNSNTKEITNPKTYTRRHESAKSQDELYVLGLVNVPNEELAKYEHIQKVSKLPENIKGYNSIELLNQFEEVIESSNTNQFKTSTSKEFMPIRDRKNAIKHIVEALPRPVSPLDVEAKISQSVIHKEVGCNFEIKPCSPKMLNAEIASPVQNILGERAIEKVSNPLINKAKSPLSIRIEGNTACNKIQRQETTPYESSSCKMVGSPFTASNMDSVKTNYSMQDLETSSGVCLASLPRLDNEIELNFPEVNQQFINANKGGHNMHEKCSQDMTESNVKLSSTNSNDTPTDDLEKYTNVPLEEESAKEIIKLSKFRKTKVNTLDYSEEKPNANAIRTDSVIIENPENARRLEENKDKISLHKILDEEENTPMNLTSQNSLHSESEYEIHSGITNSPKHETHAVDCALDFSLSKPENGLPMINCYDDEIPTMQKDESSQVLLMETVNSCLDDGNRNSCVVEPPKLYSESVSSENNTKSIIVRNQNAESDGAIQLKVETLSKTFHKSDKYFQNQVEPELTNANKTEHKVFSSKNKKDPMDKETLTNAIIKHKHKKKKKHKSLKLKADVAISSLDRELQHKIPKKSNVTESSLFDKDKSSNAKQCEIQQLNAKSVIKNNNLSNYHENIEIAVTDPCKVNIREINSCINIITDENHMISESDSVLVMNDLSKLNTIPVQQEVVKDNMKITNSSTETNVSGDLLISKCKRDNDSDLNASTLTGEIELKETNALMYQTNKYYNELISESELFVDKTYCKSPVDQTPGNSFVHEDNALKTDNIQNPNISAEDYVDDKFKQKCVTRPINDIDNDQDFKDRNLDINPAISRKVADCVEVIESKIDSIPNEICCIDDHKLHTNLKSLDDNPNNSGEHSSDTKSFCEKTRNTNNYIIDDTEIEAQSSTADVIEDLNNAVADDNLLTDKKYSIDSGYQSNKNSFIEIDDSIIEIAGNSGEDSVFVEKDADSNNVSEYFDKNEGLLQPDSDRPILTSSPCSLSIENKTYEDLNLNIKSELPSEGTQSSDLYDSIDANMQLLFEQPNKEYISKSKAYYDVSTLNIKETSNCNESEQGHVKQIEYNDVENDEQSNKILVYEDTNTQTLLNTQKETNLDEIIQPKLTDDKVAKNNIKVIKSDIRIEIKDTKNTHDEPISSNSVELTEIMDTDEPCVEPLVKCLKEVKEGADIHYKLITKRYSYYRGKELFSPRIQNLIVFNEGTISQHECINNLNKTKSQDDDTIEKLNVGSLIKVATSDQTYCMASESQVKTIEDVDNIIDFETITNNSLESSNEETRILKDSNNPENSIEIDIKEGSSTEKENKSVLETQCKEGSDAHNDSYCVASESQVKTIEDVDNIIDFETITNNSLESSNEETRILKDSNNPENSIEIDIKEGSSTEKENKSVLETQCTEGSDVQNDSIEEIVNSNSTNSITSQITNFLDVNESTLELKYGNNDLQEKKVEDNTVPINRCRTLKRSLSDSALTTHLSQGQIQESGNMQYAWPPKRNRLSEFENFVPINRRNSVNFEENVSFCILIDDNCIITEESEEKICIAELQEDYITEIDTANDDNTTGSLKDLYCSAHEIEVDYADSQVLECDDKSPVHDSWVEDIACVETVFSDEVAENVVISAPSSPTDSISEYEQDEYNIYGTATCSHTDKVKSMHGEKMSDEDAKIVDTLYRTPHMDIMNKTLLYGDKNVESDNYLSDDEQENILEPEDWKRSPTPTPDYIDPSHSPNDFRLETPENKENVFVKELSPLRRIDDYLDVSSADNETDEHIIPKHISKAENVTQDHTVHSCESSLDNVFDYKLKDEPISSTSTSYTTSSFPEVSSTTSEEKNSSILLKITNLNGSRVSQINETDTNKRSRCKFTEKKEYSSSNFPNRPLMTKAAQKYIPPIKESIRDLKVKITLPQHSLLKLKQLKLSRNEPKSHKQHNAIPRIVKKPKPNFDDVLKSIDEIQIKRHKEKSKKTKTMVPKVVIKKNENGSHYASTPKRETFNPDLTGRKWQPWVFLEKNHFIDKMAIRNKTRAIFSHRKEAYVLAEKFKKYKSVGSSKFIISHPITPGQLKYTFRLKHV